MYRIYAVVAVVALVTAAPVPAVEIHKCTDAEGRVTFSQQRCEGAEVSTIDIEVLPATGAGRPTIGSSPDYQAVTQRLADRMTQRKIRQAENRVEALTRERDDKISQYRIELTRTDDYIAGADRARQYGQLVTTTRASYNERIAAKQAEIETLRGQLHEESGQAEGDAQAQ